MTDYEKLEAIHSMLLEYLDNEYADLEGIGNSLMLIEELREPYLQEGDE